MNKPPLFPLSPKQFAVGLCGIGGIFFLFVFFFWPSPPEYHYVRTETVEVVLIPPKRSRVDRANAVAQVKFESGEIGFVPFQTRENILPGQFIEVHVMEADGERPRYRLAQPPASP